MISFLCPQEPRGRQETARAKQSRRCCASHTCSQGGHLWPREGCCFHITWFFLKLENILFCLFSHILYYDFNFPTFFPPSSFSLYLLFLPDPPSLSSPQKRRRFPGISTKFSIICYNMMSHMPSHQGWMRQFGKKKRVPKQSKESETAHSPTIKNFTRTSSYTTITYI